MDTLLYTGFKFKFIVDVLKQLIAFEKHFFALKNALKTLKTYLRLYYYLCFFFVLVLVIIYCIELRNGFLPITACYRLALSGKGAFFFLFCTTIHFE